ncbi:MAG TPA: YtxH domain-containing protein [Anaerolineae bacterium]|nr:YtxH domain-containing protein [Anaerolineae bacterium]
MAERDSDFGAFITGFVVGGLVGAAVALLLAPQSGEETRTMIRDKGIELKDQVEQTATETRVKAEQMAQDAREKARDLQQRGQVILEEQRSRIEQAVETGKRATRRKKTETEEIAGDEEPTEA